MTDKIWHIGNPEFEIDEHCPDHKVWPWNGHRLFAYDLIRFLTPELYVELGTYWGTSYFSFCQAVKDHNLPTKCVAVDTWQGDIQTGPYGQDVYESVTKGVAGFFREINTELIRSYFSDAVAQFKDESIDLLHIDGLHTYEAVKEDFETWFPKLAPDCVVLFHDIADSCDYGSVQYWHELASSYPSFSFQHSWGLGVLFPKGRYYFDCMEENNLEDKIKIYEYSSELNLATLKVNSLEGFNLQQDHLIKSQEKQIEDFKKQILKLQTTIDSVYGSRSLQILNKLGLGPTPK